MFFGQLITYLHSYFVFSLYVLEVYTGHIFQTGPGLHGYNLSPVRSKEKILARPGTKEKLKFRSEPGPAQKGNGNFGPSLAWPETKYKILAQARPGQFFFRFRPRQLGLSDFKTSLFSCLHIINVFFC